MKYFLAFIVLVAVYMNFIRTSPTAPVVPPPAEPTVLINPTAQPAQPASNFLKRPLDRANAVVQLVDHQKRSEDF